MLKGVSYIRTVTLLLKIILSLQWLAAAFFTVLIVLLIINPEMELTEKLSGFGVDYEIIELGEHDAGELLGQDSYGTDNEKHRLWLTNGRGRLHISGHSQKIIIIKVLLALVEVLAYIYIFHLLISVFSGMKEGTFFNRVNGLIIRRIAWVIITITVITEFVQFLVSDHILRNYEIRSITLQRDTNIDIRTLFFGLMLLVISIAFIRGAEIKEENELTI